MNLDQVHPGETPIEQGLVTKKECYVNDKILQQAPSIMKLLEVYYTLPQSPDQTLVLP